MMKMLARIAAFTAVTAALVGGAAAQGMDITFTTDFGFNGRHSYFFVALDKGFYKAEGLNVNIIRGQGSIDAVKKVATGAAQIGFADAGAVILARANDSIPVKLVAIIYAKPPHAVFALADSGIKVPKDLEGRTVADAPFGAQRLIFNSYALAAGIDTNKVKWISAEGSALTSLLGTHRVDAIGQFIVGQPLIETGVKPNKVVRFAYKDAGMDYYGNGIIATEETIAKSPGMIKAFVRATLKGAQYAFAHPDEAGEIMHNYHKEVTAEVGKGETELVREIADVPGRKIGEIDEKGVKNTIEVMKDAYPLKRAVDPKEVCVPGFLE
jgi:NitT/TauT family transport system substrate-binding protein